MEINEILTHLGSALFGGALGSLLTLKITRNSNSQNSNTVTNGNIVNGNLNNGNNNKNTHSNE